MVICYQAILHSNHKTTYLLKYMKVHSWFILFILAKQDDEDGWTVIFSIDNVITQFYPYTALYSSALVFTALSFTSVQ